MKVLETDQEKQSALYTAISFIVLFLLFFLLKISNETSLLELEGGGGGGEIAVNFGDSDTGMGDDFTSMETVRSAPKQTQPEVASKEEIITSENDDAPVIAEIKKIAEKPKKTDEVVKPVVKPAVKPQPSKSTNAALDALMNGTDKSGDGTDKVGGNKGKSYGDPNATGYNGGGGSGTGSGGGNGSGQGPGSGSGSGGGSGSGTGTGVGNWKLDGRKLSKRDKVQQKCNESGTVVVQVKVNRNGDVVATQYTKGTTNTDACLLQPAYETARTYKWLPNPDAPEVQVGTITINFSLGQ
jgi:membrane protein involved in colicin uptake